MQIPAGDGNRRRKRRRNREGRPSRRCFLDYDFIPLASEGY